MLLHAFGHSCFLLEIDSPHGAPLRILGDPWLQDHVVGDAMGRFPRVRIDYERLGTVDAIFLSHSHTDHCDPYSLVELWRGLPKKPRLLLPESISYLAPIFGEYLEDAEIEILAENEPFELDGVRITTLFNLEPRASNEDDVMMLVVETEREVFLSESDAVFPFYDADARAAISEILGDSERDSCCFLTTKNELEATMASMHASSVEERHEQVANAFEFTAGEVESLFDSTAEGEDDLWRNPQLVRLVGGQGICYPQDLGTEWNRVLFPISLEQRVTLERQAAQQAGYEPEIGVFEPGFSYEIAGGTIRERIPCDFLELRDREEERVYDGELELFENFPEAPLRHETRDPSAQQRRIEQVLNQRFLPYLIGFRAPAVEHLLANNPDGYRVRVRFGVPGEEREVDFVIRFSRLRFAAEEALTDTVEADEAYWANDLEDYLDGRADDFTTFCRRPLPARDNRFWSCLGMPYLNDDLVAKKMRYHFDRARAGESSADWVLRLYRSP